jgi:hypothetical protein
VGPFVRTFTVFTTSKTHWASMLQGAMVFLFFWVSAGSVEHFVIEVEVTIGQ